MKKTLIAFDLDGTLFDLYGKENWLELLRSENPSAFEGDFLPEIAISNLYSIMEKLANIGVIFEVITWLPKFASADYENKCSAVKKRWVKENLPFITNTACISYGVPKQKAINRKTGKMYLIDDNEEVGKVWKTKVQRKYVKVSKKFTVVDALEKIYKEILEEV